MILTCCCPVTRVLLIFMWIFFKVVSLRQEEKGTTENEMVAWHHQLNGHEFEQAWGVGDGKGSRACGSPWGRKESDRTERLN